MRAIWLAFTLMRRLWLKVFASFSFISHGFYGRPYISRDLLLIKDTTLTACIKYLK